MSISDADIQQLLDERAIEKCVMRYARGIDRHDSALIESAFHEDGIDHHGGAARRPSELSAWGNDLHATHTRGHQHFICNTTVEIDGDVAHSESYVLFVLWRRTEPIVDISGGRYVDRLERRGGRWGIVERVVTVDWTAEAKEGADAKGTLATYARGEWDARDVSYRRPLAWGPQDVADFSFGTRLSRPR
ncbi:nuclear transport factor 2 family protein [Microbacterium immunditiarum]|uniref:SnoaL-like domain-containing protein n=1 Tax=Microbacterium immunditiarum TaxID=337480 RepID=A0A7Y9GR10_9MICO|nr:nuclear transport factor 2 family protein [Microbacterium immunditiarum]NYE21124.1 hypothetical protein [Microbacterium immunditiarum]